MKAAFTPADPYNPMLTVEDLDDLFEERGSLETDPSLDVSSLRDFFLARESFDEDFSDVFEPPPPPRRPVLVLVRSRKEPADIPAEVEVDAPVQVDVQVQVDIQVQVEAPAQADVPVQAEYHAVFTPEPIVTPARRSSAPDAALSAIQRAVMDFERFAETFHAFARESQGLRTF